MGESVILSIKDLYKSFGGVAATNGLTLDVLEREVHAVIGPNGAGKTTLVSQVTGVVLPDAGLPAATSWHGTIFSDHQHYSGHDGA